MNLRRLPLWLGLVFACGLQAAELRPPPEPPTLTRREISEPSSSPPGTIVQLTNHTTRATLFLPEGWQMSSNPQTRLVVHFHTIAWFTIQEHLRRQSPLPLLNFALGEGSATYARPFADPPRFGEWLRLVELELISRGAPRNVRIAGVDISSFSAGYGAVREILKLETNRAVIQRIVLCDSLYGGLVDTNAPFGRRQVVREHLDPWLPFAQAAARGEKSFVLTTSAIETLRYASTSECGAALADGVGATFAVVGKDSSAAARDPNHPLLSRADLGGFHLWNYGGTNAPAHLAHVRHLADLWMTCDEADRRPGGR
jgi:hypothetical protein